MIAGREPVRGHCVIGLVFAAVLATSASGAAATARAATADEKLAFTRNGDIYVMNADGTDQHDLTRTPAAGERFPTWSSRGKRIAFAAQPHCAGWRGAGCSWIVVMNADGSDRRALSPSRPSDFRTAQPQQWQHDDEPSWSPDGREIAFATDRTAGCEFLSPDTCSEIYVMDADGERLRRLTRDKRIGPAFYPFWSPDGTEIAFSRYTTTTDDIEVMNADGTHLRRLTPTGFAPFGRATWSPDGSKVAVAGYSRADPSSFPAGIYTVDSDGSDFHLLVRCLCAGLAWSPDGREIALTVSPGLSHRRTAGIWVVKADGTGLRRLSSGPDAWPSWQPLSP
jgi:Tol biopolymer transport system component